MDSSSLHMSQSDLSVGEIRKLWELTPEEEAKLLDLQQRVQDVDHPKNLLRELVRFLRARPKNIDAAESMFRKMVAWRKENSVDNILSTYQPPEDFIRFYPGAILEGSDFEGDPVFVSRIGVTDAVGLLQRFGREEMLRHAMWHRELVVKHVQDLEVQWKRPIRRISLIEDLEGLGLSTHGDRQLLSVYGEIMRLDQDNYPETAKKLLVVRAPTLFRMIWSIAKHFFDTGVVEKMEFCGTHNYQEILSKYMDLKILPKELIPGIGEGKAAVGMPQYFEGGKVPLSPQTEAE